MLDYHITVERYFLFKLEILVKNVVFLNILGLHQLLKLFSSSTNLSLIKFGMLVYHVTADVHFWLRPYAIF